MTYVNWAISRSGYVFQLVVWGGENADVHTRGREALRGFELLEPDKVLPGFTGGEVAQPAQFSSPHGFTIDFERPWRAAANGEERGYLASYDYVAVCTGRAWVGVTAFPLQGLEATDEQVYTAMLAVEGHDGLRAAGGTALKLAAPLRGRELETSVGD
jgi:hypothetical protein